MNMIEIREKDGTISWELITELLHNAYAMRLYDGLKFAAASQFSEETEKRATREAENNITLVALDNGTLIGTITGHINGKVLSFEMFGVSPDYQKKGVGKKLLDELERRGREEGCQTITMDTARGAKDLVHYYTNRGYRKVNLVSWPNTNYYSIVFEKPLSNVSVNSWRYPIHVMYTLVRFRKDGKRRF